MLDFFKPKDKSKPITSSVSYTTIFETSDVELVSQDDFENTSLNDVIIVGKQTPDDDTDFVHIKDELVLTPVVFKFLCFFKPTASEKLKCKLPHPFKVVSSNYCYDPAYAKLKKHFDCSHKKLQLNSIENLTEYKVGSTTISLMFLVMITLFYTN